MDDEYIIPMPALDDPEGETLPEGLPPVVDAHVHLFPDDLWGPLHRWFDQHAWPIRYRMTTPEILGFLTNRGVDHIVALQYAHRPGMARALNAYMAAVCQDHDGVTGLATVFPGEPDAVSILEEAFSEGLAGVKLHLHVQGIRPDHDDLRPVYETCVAHDRPIVMHAGREPRSAAYPTDPHETCAAERTERVLRAHPQLKLCVPHLGADEFDAYRRLLERYDALWLDTTMMLADYFSMKAPWRLLEVRPDRILYGTDFPNIPYAWDREIRHLLQRRLPDDALAGILGANARTLFEIPE